MECRSAWLATSYSRLTGKHILKELLIRKCSCQRLVHSSVGFLHPFKLFFLSYAADLFMLRTMIIQSDLGGGSCEQSDVSGWLHPSGALVWQKRAEGDGVFGDIGMRDNLLRYVSNHGGRFGEGVPLGCKMLTRHKSIHIGADAIYHQDQVTQIPVPTTKWANIGSFLQCKLSWGDPGDWT